MLNADSGMLITDNALLVTLVILLITELVLLTQVLLEQVTLPPILIVIHGIMEFVKLVLKEATSMQMEFAKMLQINVTLGIMLMDSVFLAMLVMTSSMELVKSHLKILKDLLTKDVKLGIKEFVLNALLDGFSIIMVSVSLSVICAELMMLTDSA